MGEPARKRSARTARVDSVPVAAPETAAPGKREYPATLPPHVRAFLDYLVRQAFPRNQ